VLQGPQVQQVESGPAGDVGSRGPEGVSGLRQMTKQPFLNHFLNPVGTPNPTRLISGGFYLGSYLNHTGHNVQVTGSILIAGGVLPTSGTCSSWVLGVQGTSNFTHTQNDRAVFHHYEKITNASVTTIQVNTIFGPGGRLNLIIPAPTNSMVALTPISLNPGACFSATNYNSFISLRNFNPTTFVDPNPTSPPLEGPFQDP